MAHKFLRIREHHKALEARFTPTISLFPGGNDPSPTPTTPTNSDPTPDKGSGGILTPILNPPGVPSIPIQQQQPPQQPQRQTPPIFQTTTSANVVSPVVTPVAPTISTSLATLSTPTPLSSNLLTTNPTPVLAQTTPSTSLTPTSVRQVAESTVFTTVTPSSTFSGSSIPSVTPSQTPTSSGLGTGPIVGLAAAGVAGIAVLGVAGIWLFKKYVSHKDEPIDEGNFTRHSWMRNSVALNDDPADGAGAGAGVAGFGATAAAASQHNPNVRPRPPTMIERHQANFTAMRGYTPTPAQQQGQNYNDNMAGYGYSGYENPGGYDSPYNVAPPVPVMTSPGQTYPTQDINPQPYHNPIASPPPLGHSPAPSNGSNAYGAGAVPVPYFTRHNSPSSPPPTGSLPNPYVEGPNVGYANMERITSVTPFQQQTYNEISQQLERSPFVDPAIPAPPLSPVRSGTVQVVNVPDVHAGQETPVQFGYHDSQTAQPVATSSQPKRAGSVTSKKSIAGRPETMYDEEDAYGGI